MKIILTSFYLPPTDRIGAGVQMHMLANAYAEMGHDVTMISPRQDLESDSKYKLVSVKIDGPNMLLKWSLALREMKFEADFVQFSGDDFLVKSSHSFVHLRTFLGSCIAEARFSTSMRDKLRMTYAGATEVLSSMRADICTAISTDTTRYLPRQASVIPCGVDLSTFTPGALKSINPSILFVGTLDSRKRGRALVEIFERQVRSRFPDAELWIVRDTSVLDVGGVKMFGSISQSELVDLYRKAWIFCLPSSYEGFGVPYIEAMACGTCVVSTPNVGAKEVLANGEFGVISELRDLGNSLCELIRDDELRRTFVSAGQSRVNAFDMKSIAQNYINLVTGSAKYNG